MFDKLWSKFVLQLNQKSPFFACLALFTKLVPDERIEIGLTGGRELRVNPDFLLALPDEQAFSYLLHQVMHLALQHGTRRLGRDHELWNIAADIIVNEMIVESTPWPTAPMTAWDNRFKAQSVEQVYAILAAEQMPDPVSGPGTPQDENTDDAAAENEQDGQDGGEEGQSNANEAGAADNKEDHNSSGQGSAEPGTEPPTSPDANAGSDKGSDKGSDTGSNKNESGSNQSDSNQGSRPPPHPLAKLYGSRADLAGDSSEPAQKNDDTRYWNDAVSQAQTVAATRQQGELPAAMHREFERIARSRVDWRRELWRFVSDRQSDFTEFENRHIHRGLYVEELRVDGLSVVVAIDTSGSVSADELGVFMKELDAMQKLHFDVNVVLYFCDAQAHGPFKLSGKTPPTQAPVGGGGTSFTPVFDAVNQLGLIEKPDCLIYFTDGFGDFPPSPPAFPVLWVLCRDGCEESDVPFGMTIRVPYGYHAIQR